MRKNSKLKIIILTVVVLVLGIGTFIEVKAYHDDKIAKIEEKKKKEEYEKEVALEKKKKEELLKTGINIDAKQYTYDANEVWSRIKSRNFSNNNKKIAFLTFDDGTSKTITPKILATLDKYNVKATFFVVGSIIKKGGEEAQNLLREELRRGHSIGNHTYTHDYKTLYPGRVLNLENFKNELEKNEKYIKEVLGPDFKFNAVRCPGGHMSWKNMSPLDDYLKEKNLASIDWNVSSTDASYTKRTADDLVNSVIQTAKGKDFVVVLMHDTYGKETTAEALPKIIEYFHNNGYEFKTLG